MKNKKRELLFSIKDFEVETFRAGGKGGQKQNKTSSGVRIKHIASGAVGEARDSRSQHANKKEAFKRLVDSKEFQLWLKVEIEVHTNVKTEVFENGQWVEVKEISE